MADFGNGLIATPQIYVGDTYSYNYIPVNYGIGVIPKLNKPSTAGGNATYTTLNSPPTTPVLAASNITASTLDLSWTPSYDDLGVVAYDVYNGGILIASVTATRTWTQRGQAVANANRIVYLGGKFLAFRDTTGAAAYSTNGITWTPTTMQTPASANWVTPTYSGSQWLTIANQYSQASTSPDGITWTTGTGPPSTGWRAVAYGAGRYVAVGYNSGTSSYSSTNGSTWTNSYLNAGTVTTISNIIYAGGQFVVSAYGQAVCYTSPDGTTWTERTMPSGGWTHIAYGNGIYVMAQGVPAGNTTAIATSSDGITWTTRTLPISAAWSGLTFSNGTFMMIGNDNGIPNDYYWTCISQDGINWTYVQSGGSAVRPPTGSTGLAASNGFFVTVGSNFTGTFDYSPSPFYQAMINQTGYYAFTVKARDASGDTSPASNVVTYGTTPTSRSKYWDGTQWLSMDLAKVWTGSAWVPYAGQKVWNGTSWIAV